METLLTESMSSDFSISALLQGSFFRNCGEFPPKRYAAGTNRISRWSSIARSSGACGPRIDEGRRDIVKVPDISRSQGRTARENNSSDHRVAHLARTALYFSGGHQSACVLRGFGIEGSDAMVNTAQEFLEVVDESGSSFSAWHDLQAETNFKNSYRICPDGCPRLLVKPCHHCLVRYAQH